MNSEKIRNWDSTQSWMPEAIHYPEDEEQIAGLIRRAVEDQKQIKAVGAALSWSDIIDMPQLAIRFNQMAKVLEVDRDKRWIRVQAGADLKLSPMIYRGTGHPEGGRRAALFGRSAGRLCPWLASVCSQLRGCPVFPELPAVCGGVRLRAP